MWYRRSWWADLLQQFAHLLYRIDRYGKTAFALAVDAAKPFMDDQTINLAFPHPPALNHLYFNRVVGSGQSAYVQRGLTQAGRDYMELIAEICDGYTPFVGDVEVTFKWYRPRRIGDLDGIFKVILDGMSKYIYHDDKQVARIVAERFDDKNAPRVEITVRPLGLC